MNTVKKEFAVGESDFKKIITGNYYYVDKTLFIKEVIDRGDLILLLPRPRRFGKTLNISMLKYFYDCCPGTIPPAPENKQPGSPGSRNTNQNLFNSLAIENAGEKYREKMR
ncbi:MAG TPA: AAA family ATPase, partial [Candidatus Deferrimicrobium sp.]|nr:AAA family ATPase [Candidatus Deferrimicrobium sp.]